ncbi:MAG: 3'-5' exonuclease domain-containing protein 2 [Magnetococcales bacterium]|nr:3'-5' exonuclease domain-containing protein 2 [Magnetococcales bacterium]
MNLQEKNTTQVPRSTQDQSKKLSKDDINNLPIRRWEGPVILIREDDKVSQAVQLLQNETVLGFDTETKPVFRKGVSHLPSLLQLAAANTVYLFQLNQLTRFCPLQEILEDCKVIKVGVGIAQDMEQLRAVFSFVPSQCHDLGDLARSMGMESYGLRTLAARFFNFRISKRAQCSNWDSPVLKPFQVSYAATDAWISREIFLAMRREGLNLPDKKSHLHEAIQLG